MFVCLIFMLSSAICCYPKLFWGFSVYCILVQCYQQVHFLVVLIFISIVCLSLCGLYNLCHSELLRQGGCLFSVVYVICTLMEMEFLFISVLYLSTYMWYFVLIMKSECFFFCLVCIKLPWHFQWNATSCLLSLLYALTSLECSF